jgi:hypothetical protein
MCDVLSYNYCNAILIYFRFYYLNVRCQVVQLLSLFILGSLAVYNIIPILLAAYNVDLNM